MNPASFILQRLLVLPARPSTAKKGKDALYVHDVLQLFTHGGRIHNEVINQAQGVLQTLTAKERRVRHAADRFGSSHNRWCSCHRTRH